MGQYRILLFGIARDIVGASRLELEYQSPLTAPRLLEEIRNKYPEFKALKQIMLAVNEEYAGNEQLISPQDDIALIPPVSGG